MSKQGKERGKSKDGLGSKINSEGGGKKNGRFKVKGRREAKGDNITFRGGGKRSDSVRPHS